jgi:hypothetical protein
MNEEIAMSPSSQLSKILGAGNSILVDFRTEVTCIFIGT